MRKLRPALLMIVTCLAAPVWAQSEPSESPKLLSPSVRSPIDHSGESQQGMASYYHDKFAGRTMADGTPMDPEANIAASRTLPLGTKARVTNLENGKSAVVEIRDRGPYVDGRIVDVSPSIAERLGMLEQGVAEVEVTPLKVPERKGARAIRTGSR